MSDVIKLLPDAVANQIAAGEVIQRPASVIKELVENAVDAKASDIQIVLRDAGRTLIQVIDNGVGMSDTDARLAFERHSTSKIRHAEDLFQLHTMGFRGEALASIAAISQVELRTRRQDAQLGTRLLINASHCDRQEPDMCPVGSNFMIKNIFFNVPARRKFLKSNSVELSNIVKEFEKLALINYGINFTLIHNDNLMYKLNSSSFLQRITALMGHNIDQQLIPLNLETSLVKIQGYIGKPQNTRKRNCLQFMFVNERYMRHPYFHKAIMSSYEQLIPEGSQPNYFLQFTVDPQSIDVNIHPTKTEIKFEDELPIWQILAAGTKEALNRFSEVPTIDFNAQDAPTIPAYHPNQTVDFPQVEVDKSYNPFNDKTAHHSASYASMSNWQELFDNFERSKRESIQHSFTDSPLDDIPTSITDATAETPTLPFKEVPTTYLQIKGRYIISPIKSGLMFVDQHRAHVRILYDRYLTRIHASGSLASQAVMFPERITLSASQEIVLQSLLPEMEQMGFSVARLSGGQWSVNAIPAGLDGADISATIHQIIASVHDGAKPLEKQMLERLALSVARSAAIPYGRTLLPEEMDILLADLLQLPDPKYTPDGKVVIGIITMDQIEKMFH